MAPRHKGPAVQPARNLHGILSLLLLLPVVLSFQPLSSLTPCRHSINTMPPLRTHTRSHSPTTTNTSMMAARGGPGTDSMSKKKQAIQAASPQQKSRLFAWGAAGGGVDKKKKKKKEEQQQGGGGWFPNPFSSSSSTSSSSKKATKKNTKKKEENKGWFSFSFSLPFPGFTDFNSQWKDQTRLANKIKKLEKEVARDYLRGDKAKAAQYRYEVLQTLEEVQDVQEKKQQPNKEEDYDAILAGKTLASRALEVKDARLLTKQQQQQQQQQQQAQAQGAGEQQPIKPEDLDSMLAAMDTLAKDEQQWARLASACVGSTIGLMVVPSHDFFAVMGAAAIMTFLTTTNGLVGDCARMSGYVCVSAFRSLSRLEKQFSVLQKVTDVVYDGVSASVPFDLPWREQPSWRNAYKGEGFLHPDIRPAPPMRDAQYVEYLREVKRWLDKEEKEVMEVLKKKEDERVLDLLAREERKEQVQKVLVGLWGVSTSAAKGLMTVTEEMKKRKMERELKESEAIFRQIGGGSEEDVEFLRRFAALQGGGEGCGGERWEEGEGEGKKEEEV